MELNVKSGVIGIAGLVVAILLVNALLIPVTSDAEYTTGNKVEQTNVGTVFYTEATEVALSLNVATGTYTVNSTVIDLPAYASFIISSACTAGVMDTAKDCGVVDYTANAKERMTTGTVSFTLIDGKYTLTTPTTTYTGSVDTILYYSGTSGDYVQGTALTINKGADVYYKIGDNYWTNTVSCGVLGNPLAGASDITVTDYSSSPATEKTASLAWNVDNVSSGVYDISEFSIGESILLNVYVPTHYYTAEPNAQSSLITIIPLLVLVGLVMATVGVFITRRA